MFVSLQIRRLIPAACLATIVCCAIRVSADPAPNDTALQHIAGYTEMVGGEKIFNLYKAIVSPQGVMPNMKFAPPVNTYFSPLGVCESLLVGLNIINGGSVPIRVPGLPWQQDTSDVNAGNRTLLTGLQANDLDGGLKTDTTVWINYPAEGDPSLQRTCQDDYNGTVQTLDFASPSAALAVNDWLSEPKLGGAILPASALVGCDMVVANNTALVGRWTLGFDKSRTKPEPFTLADGTKVTVPMMSKVDTLMYVQKQDFQGVRIPYGAGRIAMYVFSTTGNIDVGFLLSSGMDQINEANHWYGCWNQMTPRTVAIKMPRFQMSTAQVLNDTFHPDVIDVYPNGMPGKNPQGTTVKPYIEFLSKSSIQVTEDGGRANRSATTPTAYEPPPADQPVTMTLNHPFLFAVRDDVTGALLSFGIVANPQQTTAH
jgi:serpin B